MAKASSIGPSALRQYLYMKLLDSIFDTDALRNAKSYNKEFQLRLNKSRANIEQLLKKSREITPKKQDGLNEEEFQHRSESVRDHS